jgi:hypothetical protein
VSVRRVVSAPTVRHSSGSRVVRLTTFVVGRSLSPRTGNSRSAARLGEHRGALLLCSGEAL